MHLHSPRHSFKTCSNRYMKRAALFVWCVKGAVLNVLWEQFNLKCLSIITLCRLSLRSTWKLRASSSLILRRTALWTTSAFSWTWPTTPRKIQSDRISTRKTEWINELLMFCMQNASVVGFIFSNCSQKSTVTFIFASVFRKFLCKTVYCFRDAANAWLAEIIWPEIAK